MLIKIILTAGFNISIIKGKNASLHFSAKHSNIQKFKIRTKTFAMHDMKLTGLVCRDVFASLKYVHGLPKICSKIENAFKK